MNLFQPAMRRSVIIDHWIEDFTTMKIHFIDPRLENKV
jgi:hypothetical protein